MLLFRKFGLPRSFTQCIKRFPCLFLFLPLLFVGKGRKVSLVLNQDFHSGYANENSAAYDILANNLKQEVRNTLSWN